MSEQVTTDTDERKRKQPGQFDTPTIESTIVASKVTDTEVPDPHISDMPTVPLLPPKREFYFNWWSLAAMLLLVILVGEHIPSLVASLVTTYFHPTATVTIFPTSKRYETTYQFLAVTGTA